MKAIISSILLGLIAVAAGAGAAENGKASITVVDKVTGHSVPARIHLKSREGKIIQAPGLPFWRDHFVCAGEVQLELAAGEYTYEAEHGPEFTVGKGRFVVSDGKISKVTVPMVRIADMAAEGWWSGETHVHRAPSEVELLMRAEDLHMAQVITWWRNRQGSKTVPVPAGNPLHQFDTNRFYHLLAGEDERNGGALLYFNLDQPLDMNSAKAEFPSSVVYAAEARRHAGAWIDMEKPFWLDFPLWVASGLCDSVGLANNHMHRSGMMDNEAWGRARDREKLLGPHGNGNWSQEIYYHMLNCGLRVPPSAGSASGVLPNPVGYNRVYVHVDGPLTYEKWWDGLRAGRSFVSNGPLLRCRANGELPGHIFKSGDKLEVEIEMALTSREAIAGLEIVQNGKVVHSESAPAGEPHLKPGKLTFTESGWFLVRAISAEPKTFRFASTAPFYVEVGAGKPRISKASAQFFVDWEKERAAHLDLPDGAERDAVLQAHRQAEGFWSDILARANAE